MRYTLKELDGRFIGRLAPDGKSYHIVDSLSEAQGVMFLCPKCFEKNDGRVGTHRVICWFRNRGVPDSMSPRPGRWTPDGTGLDNLTFVPGNPPTSVSVLLTSGCRWHGFVKNGRVE